MACSECGSVDLVSEMDDGFITVVCQSCGSPVDDPNQDNENESSMDEDDDCDDDEEEIINEITMEDFLGTSTEKIKSQETNKRSTGNVSESTLSKASPQKNSKDKQPRQTSRESKDYQPAQSSQKAVEEVQETSAMKCKSCGGTNFVHDTINETEQLICEDCGAFTENQDFVTTRDFTNIGSSSAVYQWSRAPGVPSFNGESQLNKGKVYGAKTIRQMCLQLNWTSYMTDQAVLLYEQLYPHKNVKHTVNIFKDALCVACMYHTARDNNVKVTLKSLIHLKKVKVKLITRALRLLKSINKSPLAPQGVSDLVDNVLAGCNFSREFVGKVRKLVGVCERGFVTQGRDHSHVVIAVAHLVWMSEDHLQRRKVSLTRFCSQHKLQFTRHLFNLQKHFKELFLTLAKQLPWVKVQVKASNYLRYLDSIANYGISVVRFADRPEVTAEMQPSSSTSSDDGKETSGRTPLVPPCMKRRLGESTANVEEPDPVLPPHVNAADLRKEDVGEGEFDDGEIDSYILTSTEVQWKENLSRSLSGKKKL